MRWDGDQDQMMALLSLCADLEPQFSNLADFLMFPALKNRTRDFTSVEKLSQKFNVLDSRSTRKQRGWPTGPNAVAMDAFRHCHGLWKAGNFNYDAALLMEADCVPLQANWIERLLGEWSGQQNLFLGHWDGPKGPSGSHMNGNLMFHPSAFDIYPDMAYGPVPGQPWDFMFWGFIRPNATPSRLIYSDYRLNTRYNPMKDCGRLFMPRQHTNPENPLFGEKLDISYLHGCKGLQGIGCVRKKLL